MGRKAKVSYETKIKACEDYLNGIFSINQLSQSLKIHKSVIRRWTYKYKENGASSLITANHNKTYSKEFKIKIVEEYFKGGVSCDDLCVKYDIHSMSTILSWIKKYNNLEELRDYDPKPEVYTKMAYRKKTTIDERIEIVNYCIEHEKDYKATATAYDVSYSQVYFWVKKFIELGEDGLSDKRGKHKQESELTEVEELRRKNKILQRKFDEAQRQVELLKKLEEVERRRYFPEQNKKQNT